MYLTNPASYVERLWNINNISTSKSDPSQTIDLETGRRSTNQNYYIQKLMQIKKDI